MPTKAKFLYFQEPLDMEPEEPITPSSGPTTQVSSSNGATASAGSQVKWKKEVLSDIEVEAENGKRPTQEKTTANRPCKEHSFLTDVADVRMMEQGLLQLLDDFHSGKLQAFGVDSSCEKMDQIREQQERLARLHFDLDLQQDLHRLDTDMARKTANENLGKLIDQLQCLSTSIQTLQKNDTPATSSTNP